MIENNSDRMIKDLQDRINEMAAWQSGINKVLEQIIDTLESHSKEIDNSQKLLDDLRKLSVVNRWRIESLPYEVSDPDILEGIFTPMIMSQKETRHQVIDEHNSISRLGDEEFALACGRKRWNYQEPDERLRKKLTEILRSDDKGFLVGLNPYFYKISGLPEESADEVRSYMRPDVRKEHCALLNRDKVYADALMHNIESDKDVAELKRLWDGRDCLFVEGCFTRMGIGNDLFDNCRSIKRILGPATNSFDSYDEIMNEVLKQPKDQLVLIAMGPTATALAYDLYKEGYWAVDIGRVDLIYEKFIANLPDLYSVRIPYKHCNVDESGAGGRVIEDVDDEKYKSQIIARVGD